MNTRNARARRREPAVLTGTATDGREHTILIPPFGPCREVRRLSAGPWICISCLNFRERGDCEHVRYMAEWEARQAKAVPPVTPPPAEESTDAP